MQIILTNTTHEYTLLIPGILLGALALSDAAEPVYPQPLTPEHNPWADKGIASNYGFGAYYTRKNVDEEWHLAEPHR